VTSADRQGIADDSLCVERGERVEILGLLKWEVEDVGLAALEEDKKEEVQRRKTWVLVFGMVVPLVRDKDLPKSYFVQ
jgi:hypothetical protein